MKKRILSLLVLFIFLASNVSLAATGESTFERVDEMYNTLTSLGIMERSYKEEYDFLDKVSKSTFVNYVCNITGDFGYGQKHNPEAIQLAEAMKLIDSGQNNLYKEIPYSEALTILVRLLGMEDYAISNGGYPYGYFIAATKLKLTDNVIHNGFDAPLDRCAVISLLYNTIYARIEEESTILYKYKRIYRVKGIVDGTEQASFLSAPRVEKGEISISGNLYKTAYNSFELLGMRVEAFVKEYNNSEDEIIFLNPVGNDEFTVFGEDVISIDTNCTELKYYMGNNEEGVSISPVAEVLYNGQLKKDYTEADFMEDDSYIRLINNNGNADYDVVMITSFKTLVVDYKQNSEAMVKNKYSYEGALESISLKPKKNDIVTIKKNGIVIGYDGISVGDVLMVAESEAFGKRIVSVMVSPETIEGTVRTISEDGYGNMVINVEGTEYTVSNTLEKAILAGDNEAIKPMPGKMYAFSLDSNGRIAYVSENINALNYAVVYAAGTTGGIDEKYSLKLYTQKGEWKVIPVADKITFDGEKNQKASEKLLGLRGGIDGEINVIAYELNKNGEIVNIDLPEPDDGMGNNRAFNTSGNSMVNKAGQNCETLTYYAAQMTLYSTSYPKHFYMSNNSKFWIIEDAAGISDTQNYGIGQKSDLLGDSQYQVIAYNIDTYGFSDLYVIVRDETSKYRQRSEGDFILVEGFGNILGSDGSEEKVVFGRSGFYDSISYAAKNSSYLTGFGTGDIIRIITDVNGKICEEPTVVHTAGNYDIPEIPAGNVMRSYNAVIKGYADKNDCTNNRIKIKCGDNDYVTVKTGSSTAVFIYNTANETITRASLGDIEGGAYMVVKINSYLAKTIVIYE